MSKFKASSAVWLLTVVAMGCDVDSDNAGGQFWAGSDGGGSMDASDESTSGGLVDGVFPGRRDRWSRDLC